MLPRKIDRKSHRQDRGAIRSPGHRAFVRGHACCACGSETALECAHVRRASNSGMSQKPSDAFTVSLCRECHAESHRGERTFEAKHKLDLMKMAEEFYRASPHRQKLDDPY